MRFARTAVTALVASTALLGVAPTQVATAADAPTELFISEYIEGSSNNKAIEIYNGTAAPVDLAAGGYDLQMFFNGSATAGLTINLSGTVAVGDVHVVAQSSANATILAQADQTSGAGWFNGDDGLALRKGGAVVDSVGQVGVDPGSEWGTGLASTQDNTLRRLPTVCAGDVVPTDAFDPSIEWTGFATDATDGLGAHSVECGDVTPPTATPVINEFSASTAGTDVEYVEVFGPAATDLSGYTVLEIEGDLSGTVTGTIDEVVALGTTSDAGLYLAALAANSLENGTITLLLVDGFSGTAGTDLDTNDDGAFDVTPWDSIVDAVAVNDGGAGDLTYGNPVLGVGYDGLAFAPGGASRIPDGTDTDATTDWVRNDFDLYGIPGANGSPSLGEAVNTPGAPNEVVEVTDVPATPRPIWDVQGDGSASAYDGERVIVDGFVVGDFQDSGQLNGFHLQEPVQTSDLIDTTSDGIFVFEGGSTVDVAVGDFVTVTGTVDEFNGLTEITNVESVTVASSELTPPAATELALPADDADREALEGMYVTLPQDLVISEYFNFDRFGEIVLTTERQDQPTAVYEPGSDEAAALAAANLLGRITLDDGRSVQNPDPAIHPNGDEFDLDNLFRGGDTVANVTGVMDFSFSLYRIQPTEGADYTAVNERPAVPDVGGDIEVASFNVLNYFTTLGSRGAATPEEFERQRAKIIAALSEIDADVVGLIEIENNTEAIADLVAGLNDELGAGTYAFIDTGVIGTDEIKVAFIYQPASVLPIGEFAILDSSVDPRFIDDKNRPALAQTFLDLSTGSPVTVAVNHLKSKGSDCNDIGDVDLGDGAGNCNLTRAAAAEALADWMDGDPTDTGVERSLIIGDLNSYDKEEPIDVLVAAGYTDLVAQFGGEYAYSYVFDGQVGYLDHALANDPLLPDVNDTEVWHINADEPDLIDYLMGFKQDAQDAIYAPDPFRSSDHDPVLIGINGTLDADLVLGLAADEVRELLASGTINRGQANALLKHLGNAIAKIDAGNDQAARSMLDGIGDQLDDFVADGILTDEEAAMLRLLIGAAIGGLS